MRRVAILITLTLGFAAGSLLGVAPAKLDARGATPVGVTRQRLGGGESAATPGFELVLARRTLAPGATTAPGHRNSGPVVLFAEAGTIGFAEYRLRPAQNRIILIHTEVDSAYSGLGLGVQLARYALDDARSSGLRIVPVCPFIASYLTTHHEYDDLLEPPARSTTPQPKADPS